MFTIGVLVKQKHDMIDSFIEQSETFFYASFRHVIYCMLVDVMSMLLKKFKLQKQK